MSKMAKQTTQEDSRADTVSGSEMMQAVLSRPRRVKAPGDPDKGRINGVVIGELSEPAENGQIMVYYAGSPGGEPIAAISTESMANKSPGRSVALSFVEGNPEQPIILGFIQEAGVEETDQSEQAQLDESPEGQKINVRLDGETMTLSADKEIVLKCGKSSITLTRAGKIILKGAYLSNHSTGVNRIKGGSVQIN